MIGWLQGRVLERTATRVLLVVGGVGYDVHVTVQNPVRTGEDAELFIHTNVREDALQLFGFADRRERELFHLLIGVPNIGPVKAMQILQTPVDDFLSMAAERNATRLAKLPGVGKKTAERLLVDLADKLGALGPAGGAPVERPPAATSTKEDLVSALVNLGYREPQAEEAAEHALARAAADSRDSDDARPIEELVRMALGSLRPGRGKE